MPGGPPPPPAVQRIRLRYAKHGRLRFASHRDFQRAFERAVRRAGIPVAYSAGFTPHPRISYANAAPTGAASEAEYLELAVVRRCVPDRLRKALDAALPPGLDVLEAVEAGPGTLADRLEVSLWQIEFPGLDDDTVAAALAAFLAADEVHVQRLTKSGLRTFDARGPVLRADLVTERVAKGTSGSCAILHLVLRHSTPAVRPDDVLAALTSQGHLAPPSPSRMTRLAQGPLDVARGAVVDPLTSDRDAAGA